MSSSDLPTNIQDAADIFYDVLETLLTDDVAAFEMVKAKVPKFPNGTDTFLGRHWLTNAIGSCSLASVQWIIEQNVDLDYCDAEGATAFSASIDRSRGDRYEILKMLISAGADVNIKGMNTYTPLHLATRRSDMKAIDILLAAGADPTIITDIDNYATPEEEARICGNPGMADFLKKRIAGL